MQITLCQRIACVLLAACLTSPTRAEDFVIANGDVPALIEALDAANANGEPDTIILAPNGRYTLTSANNTTNGPNGLPVITSDVHIQGNGSLIRRSYIQGTPQFRILCVAYTGGLLLTDLTIAGGHAYWRGGGILNSGGDLALVDCSVLDNTVDDGEGAGICNYNHDGTVSLQRVIVRNNAVRPTAGFPGGGIFNRGTLIASDCLIAENTATYGGGGICNHVGGVLDLSNCAIVDNEARAAGGGGLAIREQATLRDTLVSGNLALEDGGGIDSINASLELERCTISNNACGYGGGGIRNDRGALRATACTFAGNSAGHGGALAIRSGNQVLLDACTISGNTARGGGGGISMTEYGLGVVLFNSTVSGNSADMGGGIHVSMGMLELLSCTIAENNAFDKGGNIYGWSYDYGWDYVGIQNSIIADSAHGGEIYGSITDLGHNIVEDGFGITHGASMPGDPRLAPLRDYGGPTLTHALLPGSIAIDAGVCTADHEAVDQRGVPRPQGDRCDIGAFELESCRADFDRDGDVDTADVIAFLDAWASRDPAADFDGDGAFTSRDVLAFLNAWAASC